jgi:uncharacterized membrane protein
MGTTMPLKPQSRRLLVALLGSDGFVATVNLFLAYRARSFMNAIIAVVLWLIVAPVISVWWVRRMESDVSAEND